VRAEAIHVVGLGASTPVGRDAWSSAAAVRAGISGFAQHPWMLDSVGQPMRAAIAPWLEAGLPAQDRLEALLWPAIDEALSGIAPADMPPARTAMALGLPSARPGMPQDLQPRIARALSARYRGRIGAIACFPNGHAAGLVALDAALKKFAQGGLDACIVAGVDSYIDPDTLEWLEENDQLHGTGRLNNAWGFIPGEGAGAALLVRNEAAHRLKLEPLASVLGTGLAVESRRMKTETVCTGEGLTQAFRSVFAMLPAGERVSDIYCDLNGEPYRADEYGFTCLRTGEHMADAGDFVAPADCWGDVAAAGSMLHLVLAAAAGSKRYAKGRIALLWSSSEGGERAAALVSVGARA
jgi:3-oxoacyl-[acyl-carrier-protein] synthase I